MKHICAILIVALCYGIWTFLLKAESSCACGHVHGMGPIYLLSYGDHKPFHRLPKKCLINHVVSSMKWAPVCFLNSFRNNKFRWNCRMKCNSLLLCYFKNSSQSPSQILKIHTGHHKKLGIVKYLMYCLDMFWRLTEFSQNTKSFGLHTLSFQKLETLLFLCISIICMFISVCVRNKVQRHFQSYFKGHNFILLWMLLESFVLFSAMVYIKRRGTLDPLAVLVLYIPSQLHSHTGANYPN